MGEIAENSISGLNKGNFGCQGSIDDWLCRLLAPLSFSVYAYNGGHYCPTHRYSSRLNNYPWCIALAPMVTIVIHSKEVYGVRGVGDWWLRVADQAREFYRSMATDWWFFLPTPLNSKSAKILGSIEWCVIVNYWTTPMVMVISHKWNKRK